MVPLLRKIVIKTEATEALKQILQEHSDLGGCLILCASSLQTHLRICEAAQKPKSTILINAYKQAIEVLSQYDLIEADQWQEF